MINVAKAVIERGNLILLIKRSSDSKFFPEQWDFPGGKTKDDEKPSDSVIRETEEETSLLVKVGKNVLEGDYEEQGVVIHYRIYLIPEYKGKVNLSKDHSEFKWVPRDRMENYSITPFVRRFFENS